MATRIDPWLVGPQYWVGWEAFSWQTSWGYAADGEPIEVEATLPPGGHWKHLFKRAQNANAPFKRVEGHCRVAFLRPETTVGIESAEVVVKRVTGTSYVGSIIPTTGSSVQLRPIHAGSRVARLKIKCNACLYTSRIYGEGRAFAFASAGAALSIRGVSSGGYVGRYVVKAVQNPTEEMLMLLI